MLSRLLLLLLLLLPALLLLVPPGAGHRFKPSFRPPKFRPPEFRPRPRSLAAPSVSRRRRRQLAGTAPASAYSCRFHIAVSGAGTAALNGIYYDETGELSDNAIYYYKWSAELNDWLLLFRATSEVDGLQYWVFMSVAQLNAADYRDYYLIQDASAWPPDSGWSGSDADATYSLGALPNPSIAKTASGWIWDENIAECVRECTSLIPTPLFDCGFLNIQGAVDATQVNGNYSFMPTEISDCVPSYFLFQGDGIVDANGNRSWAPANTLLVYRYFYFGTTWWVMQDAEQLSDTAEFIEHYSVVSNTSESTPPATGWRKTKSLAVQDADPNVKPVVCTLWPNCTVEESRIAAELSDSLDAPATGAKPDVKDIGGGTRTLPLTPSNSPRGKSSEFNQKSSASLSSVVRRSVALLGVAASALCWGALLLI
jgi:hypothetical protein